VSGNAAKPGGQMNRPSDDQNDNPDEDQIGENS